MTAQWVKLTSAQAAQLASLSGSNTGNHFIEAVTDTKGAKWISADVLTEPNFAHYAPLLATLTASAQTPELPASGC